MAAREWVLAWPADSAWHRACGAGVAGRTTVPVRCVSFPPPHSPASSQSRTTTTPSPPHDRDCSFPGGKSCCRGRSGLLRGRPCGPPGRISLQLLCLPSISIYLKTSTAKELDGTVGGGACSGAAVAGGQRPEGSALVPIRAMLFNRNELEQNLISLVGASRLELLHQDIRGRLAEFSSNQEKESSIANTSEAGCTDKAVSEAHVARWRSLFVHMDKALQEEGKQPENRFKQVQEMQLNCDKGLKHMAYEAPLLGPMAERWCCSYPCSGSLASIAHFKSVLSA